MNVLGKTYGAVSHCLLQGFEIRVVILLRLAANQGYCSVFSAILLLSSISGDGKEIDSYLCQKH